ncbi:MAG TPA: helix-turn-helix transcriptional regulator [Clostridia bacterium]|nr:helix-turn-helix transcriptional regulator [Clostridia bacterium]
MKNSKDLRLAHLLKQARKTASLSQKQLAQKLGVSDKTISAYESSRAIPPLPTLKKIAQITSQPLSFFLEEENNSEVALINEKLNIIIEEIKKIKLLK